MVERALTHAGNLVAHYPRTLMSVMVALLAGTGVTAFGISPMAPDASNLPKRMLSEEVRPVGLPAQLEELALHSVQLFRSDVTRDRDTVDTLLQRLGVDDLQAATFLRTDPVARRLLDGRTEKMLQVRTDSNGALEELVARSPATAADQFLTHFTRLRVVRTNGKLNASLQTAPLATQVRLGSGSIKSSLFAATDEARIPDVIASQLSEMFSTDIDFHRELRKGDTFTLVYEALTADGEPVIWNQAAGRLLAAEFVNDGRAYSSVWFKDGSSKGAYYTFDGQSKHREFLTSPLEFSRVTSGFNMRMHPIQHTWKAHLGVDYGAPQGAPVRTVGDGTVAFAGWQNGYGNVIQIEHSQDRSSMYAHLSRISVRQGQRVEQGQRIGAVGATGWATGPHLHFEWRVAGKHRDPLTLAKSTEAVPLSAEGRGRFAALSQSMKSQLDAAETAARAGRYAE